ncbi:MAG: hypothetical protein CL920_28760 [Deltaproteobacteria bacterium]|nr:hypothetical protein [Deltaproteobacteria bacterium]MBU52708.1 hypothetical protein [Deltaproteobacteria bacterium]
MIDEHDGIAQLRTILLQEPGREQWQQLCQILLEWPNASTLSAAVHYVLPHLESWPDTLRRPGYGWVADLQANGFRPYWEVVRCLDMFTTPDVFERLQEHAHRLTIRKFRWNSSKHTLDSFLELLSYPLLSQIESLDVSERQLHDDGLATLLEHPTVGGVKRLRLEACHLSAHGLQKLLQAPVFSALHTLDISRNGLGNKGMKYLADFEGESALRCLKMDYCGLSKMGARYLSFSSLLSGLESLSISGNPLLDSGIRILSERADFTWLRSLALSECGIGADGIRALSKVSFPALQELHLHQSVPGDVGAIALSRASLPSLVRLSLGFCGLGDEQLAALLQAPFWPQLEEIFLSHNDISDDGFSLMGRSVPPRLRMLNVSQNRITDQGMESFFVKGHFPDLERLYIEHNQVGDAGLLAMAQAKMPRLRSIQASSCNVGDHGIFSLCRASWSQQLHILWLCCNRIGEEGGRALFELAERASFGELNLANNKLPSSFVANAEGHPLRKKIRFLNLLGNMGEWGG